MTALAHQPSLAEINAALERPRLGLRFPKPLEQLYLVSYMAERQPMAALWTVVGVFLSCLGYLGDQTMMADNAHLLFLLRFGGILPYGLVVIAVMVFWPTARRYEMASAGIAVLATLLPMSVLAITQSPYAFIYQTGTVSTLLYVAVLLRPRFYAVLIGVLSVIVIQLTTTAINGSFDEVIYTGIVTFYMTFTAFLLLAAYAMEQGARRSFLHNLRNEILTEQLRYQSEHDDLSELKNRRALKAYMDGLWAPGACERVSAILFDIDDFKRYNDVHGHIAGDGCIRLVATTALEVVGERGIVFRYGGEEFCVILADVSMVQAYDLAEQLRQKLMQAAIPNLGATGAAGAIVTVSLGVSEARPAQVNADQLIVEADMALYQAKRMGKNRVYPVPQ